MEYSTQQIKQAKLLREKTHKSYAEIAQILFGDVLLGKSLRSSIRLYDLQQSSPVILSPLSKLFEDPLTVSVIPTLVISDTHAPYQNKAVLESIYEFARIYKITRLIHAGDLIDGGQYNSQSKNDGDKIYPIEVEIDHARSILKTLQKVFKEIVIMPGNHDHFYTKKEKISFREFICDRILENKNTSQITVTEYDYIFYSDFAIIGHPLSYETIPGSLASKIADKYNMHALIAHDHIQGVMKAENGKYGVSIGMMAEHNRFWYKERSLTTFPHSNVGFALIDKNKIVLFDENMKGTQIV